MTNFRVRENKLLADWHLLKSHPLKNQILEVAERMPSGVGLSVAFVTLDSGSIGKARCEELISVDYVTLPAANPDGLFGAVIDGPSRSRCDRAEFVSRVHTILLERRATIEVIEKAIAKNVEVPMPWRDEARAVARQAERPSVRRVAGRVVKIAAAAGVGSYLAKRYGRKAGAVTGAAIGALLFQDAAVRKNIELSIRHAKQLTNL